jgi:N-succinyldiaminopimelate aminotransferase
LVAFVAVADRVLASRLRGFGSTIFAEMTALAARTGAVNLGQGFPDTDGPPEVLEAARAAIAGGVNQYPPLPGQAVLREAIARHQRRFHQLEVDPDSEVLVTTGATEAIAAALLALCEPGDEVVAFEPTYDSYGAGVALAGATLRPVTLRPEASGRYRFDPGELSAAFGARTRLVLLNTPHNPTGKVFTEAELDLVADLCRAHGAWCVTDEVYEHLVYDGRCHRPMAGRPGMAERTLTVSSAGKTFSVTGWKIGWVCGPAPLVGAVRTAKQFLTFTTGAPFQPAVAAGLDLPDAYFAGFRDDLRAKRDRLVAGLAAAGFRPLPPEGTYFVTADISDLTDQDDVAFCLGLPERAGVVAVPTSVFHHTPGEGRHLVRFAFCKRPEVLDEAVARLVTAFG